MKRLVAFFLMFSMLCAMGASLGCGKTEEKKPATTPPAGDPAKK